MHYTVVAAILAGAAVFLWVSGPGRRLPLLLLGLCYLVRSQVFFLALPFLLAAVLDRALETLRGRPARPVAAESKATGEQVPEPRSAGPAAVEGKAREQMPEPRSAGPVATESNAIGEQVPEPRSLGPTAPEGGAAGKQMTESQTPKTPGHKFRLCLRQQGVPLLILAVTVAVFWGIDRMGYGSEDWQNYLEYNDSRTKLYDYTDFLSTDWYQERYEGLDLSWEQYQVLAHYDTMLDQDIDAQMLNRTVRRIRDLRGDVVTDEYLRQCLATYYRHVRYDGRPYSLVWAGCYGILLILFAGRKRWGKALFLGALFCGRSLVWVYLIARGRFPERIWLSLYLIEICLLLGMVLREYIQGREVSAGGRKRGLSMGIVPLGLALMGVVAVGQLVDVSRRVDEQQEKQEQWNQLTESLAEQGDGLYLMDVFSAVAYAGELYRQDSEQILLLGGWLTWSPLVQQRLAVYEARDGVQALRHGQVRLIAAADRDVSWLEDYLKQRLGEVELRNQESIACGEGVEFVVYRLENSNTD